MKIRKPFVMGGMLLVAALLFLSMFMDMSAPQEMERQTISLRAEAEDLSIDDMINTSDKRKSPSNDVVAPGFAGNVGEYASSSVSTYREDDPEAIARIQAAIRENEENLSASLRNIEAERKGRHYPASLRPGVMNMPGMTVSKRMGWKSLRRVIRRMMKRCRWPVRKRLLHSTVSVLLLQVTEMRLRHMYIRSRS